MTKRINTLPNAIDDVISLGTTALTGAVAIGLGIPLTINTPPPLRPTCTTLSATLQLRSCRANRRNTPRRKPR